MRTFRDQPIKRLRGDRHTGATWREQQRIKHKIALAIIKESGGEEVGYRKRIRRSKRGQKQEKANYALKSTVKNWTILN